MVSARNDVAPSVTCDNVCDIHHKPPTGGQASGHTTLEKMVGRRLGNYPSVSNALFKGTDLFVSFSVALDIYKQSSYNIYIYFHKLSKQSLPLQVVYKP